jgi:hypothetical protein
VAFRRTARRTLPGLLALSTTAVLLGPATTAQADGSPSGTHITAASVGVTSAHAGDPVPITATVLDSNNNPAPDVEVDFWVKDPASPVATDPQSATPSANAVHVRTGADGVASTTMTAPAGTAGWRFEAALYDEANGTTATPVVVAGTVDLLPTITLGAAAAVGAGIARNTPFTTDDPNPTRITVQVLRGDGSWQTLRSFEPGSSRTAVLWWEKSGTVRYRIASPPHDHVIAGTSNVVAMTVNARALPAWQVRLNGLRRANGVGAVAEDTAVSALVAKHTRYMASNNIICHCEDAGRRYYSQAGDAIARASILSLIAGRKSAAQDVGALVYLTESPYHAQDIFESGALSVGWASSESMDSGHWVYAAGMSIAAKTSRSYSTSPSWAYPINNSTIYQHVFGGESPDPLANCSGYRSFAVGVPVHVMFAHQSVDGDPLPEDKGQPQVTGTTLYENGKVMAHCRIVSSTDRNAIYWSGYHVVLVPNRALVAGRSYKAVVTTSNYGTRTVAFAVR